MADLNQRFLTYLQGLRNTKEVAHPTEPQDSSSSSRLDFPNVQNVTPTRSDYNTVYYLNIP